MHKQRHKKHEGRHAMKVCKICLEPAFSRLDLIRHMRLVHHSDKPRNYAERKRKEALATPMEDSHFDGERWD